MAIKVTVVDDAPPSLTLTDITPELAEELLAQNHRNRTIRTSTVNAYARDMSNGKWQVTGECLKIAPNGDLIDGQHRLWAVVYSGVTVPMFVARGIHADAQKVLDTGVGRSAADMLAMAGHRNSRNLAGSARLAMLYEAGTISDSQRRSARITNAEVGEYLEKHPDLIDAVQEALHYRRTIDLPPSILSVSWWLLKAIDSDAADEFFTSLANHTTDGIGDPRNALIQRLNRARRMNEYISQEAQLSLLFRAWNVWRKGGRLHKIPIRSTADQAVIPVPLPI